MSSATPSATNTAVSSAQPAAFKVVGVVWHFEQLFGQGPDLFFL